MPVSKSLKKLQKRKSDVALHARSLKYKQFTSAELRQNKLDSKKAQRGEVQEVRLERYKFIKGVCENLGQSTYTIDQMRTVIQEFIDRNQPEIAKLEKERRPGRPPSNKLLNLKNLVDFETQEYKSGFNMVDLTDPKTVESLLAWNGTWGGINTLKMTRISRDE